MLGKYTARYRSDCPARPWISSSVASHGSTPSIMTFPDRTIRSLPRGESAHVGVQKRKAKNGLQPGLAASSTSPGLWLRSDTAVSLDHASSPIRRSISREIRIAPALVRCSPQARIWSKSAPDSGLADIGAFGVEVLLRNVGYDLRL